MGVGTQTVEKFFTNRSGQKLNLIIHSTNVRGRNLMFMDLNIDFDNRIN